MNHFNLNKNTPLRITVILVVFGTFWIAVSDLVLSIFVPARGDMIYIQPLLDWIFTAAAATLFYHLMKRASVFNQQMMDELKFSEEKFLKFFQSSSDLIAVMAKDNGEIIEVNKSCLDFTGFKRNDFTGKSSTGILDRITHEYDKKKFEEQLAGNGFVKNQEIRMKNRHGIYHTFLVTTEPMKLNNRDCLLTISRDITDQKKAADEFIYNKTRQYSEFLNTLLNAVPNPVFVVSKEKKLTNFNQAFEKLPESEKVQLVEFADMIRPDSEMTGESENYNGSDSASRWPTMEFKYVDEDYNEFYFLVNKALFYDADGSVGGWMGILDDITDYHKLQSETKKALEKEIELNTLKSRFMTNASHEFRTPLTVILASADLLDMFGRNWPEEKYLEHTGKIRRTVRYMTELLDDVLNISRDETGKLTFRPAQINLKTVCLDVIELARSRNIQNCEIMFDYTGNNEIVYADERIIRQILMNLLVNALKYSHKNGLVKILVKVSEAETDIEISDEGIGIPEDKLQTIFEPFNRGSNVGAVAGTGLGLSIVKKSIEMHSGSIAIKSKVDAGTAVYVNLPLKNN